MLFLYTALFLLFALVEGSNLGEDLSLVEIQDETGRVVGGQPAQNGMFPWTVALYLDDIFVCTASLISETTVLTAAHCVVYNGKTEPAYSLSGVVGVANRSSKEGTRIFFKKVTPHPKYDEMQNDLAILETDAPIEFTKTVQPICIAPSKIGTLSLKRVVAMGWGQNSRDETNTATPDVLQFANQRVVSNLKCKLLFLGNTVPNNVLCASGILSGICFGDSGGPLVYYQSKKPIQVGVASFMNTITGCGRYLGPAGFVRVSSYTDFIMNTATGKVCVA